MTEQPKPTKPHDQPLSEEEVSNVDLQFMGAVDPIAEKEARIAAEQKPVPAEQRGMEAQDVAVAQTMDASDPPSTNMGDDK